MPGSFTVSQFKRWDDAARTARPAAPTDDDIEDSIVVSGLALHGISDGVVLRICDDAGKVQTFAINAALAVRLADAIPAAAEMRGWLRADGSIDACPDRPERRDRE